VRLPCRELSPIISHFLRPTSAFCFGFVGNHLNVCLAWHPPKRNLRWCLLTHQWCGEYFKAVVCRYILMLFYMTYHRRISVRWKCFAGRHDLWDKADTLSSQLCRMARSTQPKLPQMGFVRGVFRWIIAGNMLHYTVTWTQDTNFLHIYTDCLEYYNTVCY